MVQFISHLTSCCYSNDFDQIDPIPMADSNIQETDICSFSYWKERTLQFGELFYKDSQITSLAWRALGILAAAAAGSLMGITTIGIKASAAAKLIPLSLITSSMSFWLAWNVENEKSTRSLDEIRKETLNLTLDQLLSCYDWNNIFTLGILTSDEFAYAYRKHIESFSLLEACSFYELATQQLQGCSKAKYLYFIPRPEEFKDKWVSDTSSKSFETIINEYPIEKLYQYNIIGADEMHMIREVNGFYQQVKAQYDVAKKEIDEAFPQLNTLRSELEVDYTEIDRFYNQNSVLIQLGTCDSEYYAKHSEIQNASKQKKIEAFSQCNQILSSVSYRSVNRLNPQSRDQYNQLFQLYLQDAEKIDVDQKVALQTLADKYGQNREHLSKQLVDAQKERAVKRSSAEEVFRNKCNPYQTRRHELLRPVEERFINNVKSLNRQFEIGRQMLFAR